MPRVVRGSWGSPGAGSHITDGGDWVIVIGEGTPAERRVVATLLHQVQTDPRLARMGPIPPVKPADIHDTLAQWLEAWATRDPASSPWQDDPEGVLHLYGAIVRTLAVLDDLPPDAASAILRALACELVPVT